MNSECECADVYADCGLCIHSFPAFFLPISFCRRSRTLANVVKLSLLKYGGGSFIPIVYIK